MLRTILRAVESLIVGFVCSGTVARKLATTHQWYVERGYQTVTNPLSVWKIILLALIVAVILFAISSFVACVKKWAAPVAPASNTTAKTTP